MNKKIARAQHAAAEAPHKNLRRRIGTAVVSGCLALSMTPAIALAAPMDQGGASQGGNPPQMQQGQMPEQGQMQQGQMPDGQQPSEQGQQPGGQMPGGQMPDGQQPGGQMPGQPPADSETDAQIRQILSEQYGIEAPSLDGAEPGEAPQFDPSNPGDPSQAPAIPEGQINVQQIIDSVRDAMRYCLDQNLSELDFTDTAFTDALGEYVTATNSDRQAMFQNGTAPSEAQPPAGATQGEAPAPADPNNSAFASSASSFVDFVVNLFGYATA